MANMIILGLRAGSGIITLICTIIVATGSGFRVNGQAVRVRYASSSYKMKHGISKWDDDGHPIYDDMFGQISGAFAMQFLALLAIGALIVVPLVGYGHAMIEMVVAGVTALFTFIAMSLEFSAGACSGAQRYDERSCIVGSWIAAGVLSLLVIGMLCADIYFTFMASRMTAPTSQSSGKQEEQQVQQTQPEEQPQ